MSPRDWKDRIRDILDAIYEIQSFVKDMNFPDFRNDPKTMRAVELDLMIIGEAANAFPEELQEKYPEIPWQLIRGIRNRIVHSYFSISPTILWDTIHQDISPLAELLESILQR